MHGLTSMLCGDINYLSKREVLYGNNTQKDESTHGGCCIETSPHTPAGGDVVGEAGVQTGAVPLHSPLD